MTVLSLEFSEAVYFSNPCQNWIDYWCDQFFTFTHNFHSSCVIMSSSRGSSWHCVGFSFILSPVWSCQYCSDMEDSWKCYWFHCLPPDKAEKWWFTYSVLVIWDVCLSFIMCTALSRWWSSRDFVGHGVFLLHKTDEGWFSSVHGFLISLQILHILNLYLAIASAVALAEVNISYPACRELTK